MDLELIYKKDYSIKPLNPVDILLPTTNAQTLVVCIDMVGAKATWKNAGRVSQLYIGSNNAITESTPKPVDLGQPTEIPIIPFGSLKLRYYPNQWITRFSISIYARPVEIPSHTHSVNQIDGLTDLLATPSIGSISGLQTALDGKASTVHAHGISDVSGLQTALDGKASAVHAHDTRFAAPDGYYYIGPGSVSAASFGSNINLFLLEINSPIAMSSIGVNCAGNQVGVFTLGLYRINAWSDSVRLWQSPSLTPVDLAWIDTPCNLSLNAGLYWFAVTASVQVNLWAGLAVFTRFGRVGVSTTPATGYVLSGQTYSGSLPQSINITAPVGGSTWALTNQRIPVIRYR
jgi:hypothetical protein